MRKRLSRIDAPPEPRIVAEVSERALLGNYEAIRSQASGLSVLPMLKANAYGHGADWAARLLAARSDLYGFGVATLEEGAEVRNALWPRYRRLPVIVFSGCAPWSEGKGQFCERYGLTPVIATDEDWAAFFKGGWASRLSYELKFNTGMNRLGMSIGKAPAVARALRSCSSTEHPAGVLTHLAMAESPDSKVSVLQRDRFAALRSEFAGACPSAQFHFGNSAAIWNSKHWSLSRLTDVVRPGLALYGVPPWAGAPLRGIAPVMTLRASVVAVHRLKLGESVGYGATFTVGREGGPVKVAVLAAGYADGVPRALSNAGYTWISGQAKRFVGVVSMDLCTVECSAATRAGDWAELVGPNIDLWAQAKAAGTIPYEILTSISGRVQRIHA